MTIGSEQQKTNMKEDYEYLPDWAIIVQNK